MSCRIVRAAKSIVSRSVQLRVSRQPVASSCGAPRSLATAGRPSPILRNSPVPPGGISKAWIPGQPLYSTLERVHGLCVSTSMATDRGSAAAVAGQRASPYGKRAADWKPVREGGADPLVRSPAAVAPILPLTIQPPQDTAAAASALPQLSPDERGNKKQRRSLQATLVGGRLPPAASAARPASRAGRSSVPEGQPGVADLGQGALVAYLTDVWPAEEAEGLLQALLAEVRWEQREVRVMGRMCAQPRLISYQADEPSLRYRYSGLQLEPEPWSPAVQSIKEKLEHVAGTTFDSCLLNLYRDGSDSMGWHSDNEALYGKLPVIGSVSFGARRDFMLRCNADTTRKVRYPLGAGDVLVMRGSTQDLWTHSLPKRAGTEMSRVNLTFRKIVHRQG